MTLWCKLRHSNLNFFSHQLGRTYFQISGACLANHASSNTRVLNQPDLICPRGPTKFPQNVRFFAAPVQAKPKDKKDNSGPRVNENIIADTVRLIIEEGEHIGNYIVTRSAALRRAKELNLDLVEVQRSVNPPVCKIMDFHRERYKKKICIKERAKSKVSMKKGACKDIKFTGKIELKDLKIKADMVTRMMEKGYRVKCTALPLKKPTEDGEAVEDLGGLLSQLSDLIKDVSIIESGPLVERSQAYMVVRHIKFGPSKKGSGKNASKALRPSTEVEKDSMGQPNVSTLGSTGTPDVDEESESEFETEQDVSDYDSPEQKKTTWSSVGADGDIYRGFDLRKGEDKAKRSNGEKAGGFSGSSEILGSRAVLGSDKANGIPSFPSQPPSGADNRYKRSGPSNRNQPIDARESKAFNVNGFTRADPRSPYQRKQQPIDLPTRQQVGTDSAITRNPRTANESYSQTLSHPVSKAGYGVFSALKAVPPGTPGIAQSNWNKKITPTDFTVGLGLKPASVNSNSSTVRPDNCRKPTSDDNRGRTQKWGVFSETTSKLVSNMAPRQQGTVAEGNKTSEGSPTDSKRVQWGMFSGDGSK